jgi:hypothetical protein
MLGRCTSDQIMISVDLFLSDFAQTSLVEPYQTSTDDTNRS